MRSKNLAVAALIAFAACVPVLGAEDEDARPGLAVLPAENRIKNQWWAESGAVAGQDIFISRLVEAGEYRVLDRSGFDSLIQQQALWLPAGELSPAGAVKLSRQLGVDYLVTGVLSEYGTGREGSKGDGGRRLMGLLAPRKFAVAFSARLIDGETGAILWTEARRDERAPEAEPAADLEMGVHAEEARMFEEVLRPMIESLADRLAGRESSQSPTRRETRGGKRSSDRPTS